MVAVSVFVGAVNLGAPLLITVVWAKVGDHDNDAVTGDATCTTGAAWRVASRSQVIAFTASSSAPGRVIGVE